MFSILGLSLALQSFGQGFIEKDSCSNFEEKIKYQQGYERHSEYLEEFWQVYGGSCLNLEVLQEQSNPGDLLQNCYHQGKIMAHLDFFEHRSLDCVTSCRDLGEYLSELGASFTCHTFDRVRKLEYGSGHGRGPQPIRICDMAGLTECTNGYDKYLHSIQEMGSFTGFGDGFFWDDPEVPEETRVCEPNFSAQRRIKQDLCQHQRLEEIKAAIEEYNRNIELLPPRLEPIHWEPLPGRTRPIEMLSRRTDAIPGEDFPLPLLPDEPFTPISSFSEYSVEVQMKAILPDYYDWW